jgi:spermidine synthase
MEWMRRIPQIGKNPKGCIQFLFWVICFWVGAAIMAYELIGARLLMPVFGMGIEIWAIVIAVSLGGLSIGYFFGGLFGDARPSELTLLFILSCACISLFLEQIFGRSLMDLFANFSLIAGALYCSIFILAPPIFFLGMVPPILSRLLMGNTQRSGIIVGSVMAIGTVGSVSGTILTGLFLLPWFGVSNTLMFLSVGTAGLAVAGIISLRRWKTAVLILFILGLIMFAGQYWQSQIKKIGPMQVLEDCEGLYGHLEVLEYHGQRALLCNGIFQTVMPASEFGIGRGTLLKGRDYIELLPYFRSDAHTALLIGLGGGLYERVLSIYGLDVEAIEIEPDIIKLAKTYFCMAGKASVCDGRVFLSRSSQKYDVIIEDVFIGASVPEHLFTKEAYELIREHLNPDGVLAIHLSGWPKHIAIRTVAKTVQSVFPHFAAARSGIADETQHIFMFASMTDLQLKGAEHFELQKYGFTGQEFCQIDTNNVPLLTDDRTGLNFMSRDIIASHQRNSMQIRGKPLW